MCGDQRRLVKLFIIALFCAFFCFDVSLGYAVLPPNQSESSSEVVENKVAENAVVTLRPAVEQPPKKRRLTLSLPPLLLAISPSVLQPVEGVPNPAHSGVSKPIPRDHVKAGEVQDIANLDLVSQSIEAFLGSEKIPGKRDQIVLISDLDGVVTLVSNPALFYHAERAAQKVEPVQPRIETIEALKLWNKNGVYTIVSSAWAHFDDSLQRIIDVGLAPILGSSLKLEGAVENGFTEKVVKSTWEQEHHFHFYQSGSVVSVDRQPHEGGGYLYKALSPLGVLSPEQLSQVKKVIFLDDSKFNHTLFLEHSYEFNIYQASGDDPIEIERFYFNAK